MATDRQMYGNNRRRGESYQDYMRRAQKGVFAPSRAGIGPSRYLNPKLIAGRQPSGAGNVGPAPIENEPERVMPTVTPFAPRTIAPIQTPAMSSMNPANITGMVGYSGSGTRSGGLTDPTAEATRQAISKENKTPEQYAQDWNDANVTANAQLPGMDGAAAMKPINMFGGGRHLDSSFVYTGRTEKNKDAYDIWKQLTKDAAPRINEALARRQNIPQTMEEAQEFVNSLGLDDRVGEFAEQYVTNYIQRANPELYRQIVAQKQVRDANNTAFADWFRTYGGDPNAVSMSDQDIVQQYKTPDMEYTFQTDPRAVRYGYNPAAGKVQQLPPRAPSREELMDEKRKERDYQRRENTRVTLITNADIAFQKQLDQWEGAPPPEEVQKLQAAYEQNIARINQQYGEERTGTPAQGQLPQISSESEIASLPPGSSFIAPDGSVKQVPAQNAPPPQTPQGQGTMTMGGRTVTTPPPSPEQPISAPQTPPPLGSTTSAGEQLAEDMTPTGRTGASATWEATPQITSQQLDEVEQEAMQILNQERALQGKRALSKRKTFDKVYGAELAAKMFDRAYDKMAKNIRRNQT